MTDLTVTDVADRFEEAAYTLKRLPPEKLPGGYRAWPEVVRDIYEKMQEDKLPMRLGSPPADAITRMEEVLDWVFWLDEDERKLVWMRAEGIIWKQICWRIGCGRTKAWSMWSVALLKIVTRLKAKQGER